MIQTSFKLPVHNYIGFAPQKYFCVDDYGDEDYTDYEDTDAEEAGGVPAEDMPKFRQLVRDLKKQYKATYGKGFCRKKNTACADKKKAAVNTYPVCQSGRKCFGWRKKWKEFKQAGGLKQLKNQAKRKPTTSTTDEDWVKIGNENDIVYVPNNTTVRYGVSGKWKTKMMSGNFKADNATFGDPAPQEKKEIWRKIKSSEPTPPPSNGTGDTFNDTFDDTFDDSAASIGEIFKGNWKKYAVIAGVLVAFVGATLIAIKYFYGKQKLTHN